MKSLKDIYGHGPKKLTAEGLRKIIQEEISLLREQEEKTDTESSVTFTNQSNFKDFTDPMIDELFKQINSRDSGASIFKAMSFTDDDGKTHSPDPDAVADWLEGKGEDAVRERIKDVGGKIPSTGLPKSDMPFLPGPKDAEGEVSQLVDALDGAEGEFSVDIEAPFAEEEEVKESWIKGIDTLLTEKELPAKNSFVGLDNPASQAFMTGGKKDNEDGDDTIQVVPGGGMAASAAKPTQTNILLPKALGMAVNGVEGGDLKAYASLDNEILDGHHRWAATMLNNPGADIGTIAKVDLAKFGTDETLKILTLVGNALGNKTKTETASKGDKDNLVMERWKRLAGIL